jgi:hypothetical protein
MYTHIGLLVQVLTSHAHSYSLIDKSLIMVLTWVIILLVMETPCSSPNKTHPLDPEKAVLYSSRQSNLVETFIPAMLQLVVHPKNYYICNEFVNSHCPIFNNSHPWTYTHFDGPFFFCSISPNWACNSKTKQNLILKSCLLTGRVIRKNTHLHPSQMGWLLNDPFLKAECPEPIPEHLISQMQFATLKFCNTKLWWNPFNWSPRQSITVSHHFNSLNPHSVTSWWSMMGSFYPTDIQFEHYSFKKANKVLPSFWQFWMKASNLCGSEKQIIVENQISRCQMGTAE